MVRTKYIVIAGLLILSVVFVRPCLFQSEKDKVKKQFDLLTEYVSKERGEKVLKTALKIKGLGMLFAESCMLEAPEYLISGSYANPEVTNLANYARLQFSKLSLRFYDLGINLQNKEVGKANLTCRVKGILNSGENMDEIHEL
ncbi:MAG TPA: hypothetical protein DDW42_08580, partial [Desulfobacteraceae bacterium]|nr:hypothetical protein [Desulfobacteraceae bacterium]